MARSTGALQLQQARATPTLCHMRWQELRCFEALILVMDQTEVLELRFRIGPPLLGAILVFVTLLCAGCSDRSHPDDRIRLTDPPNVKPAQTFSPRVLQCPGAAASVLSDPHTIVLTWNPSRSASGVPDPSIRYCVYRSDKAIKAARRLDCPRCQPITPSPVMGTSCVDNFGDGTKTYYYAATAMDAWGKESAFSNKITARLNRQQAASSAANRQTPQPCRGPIGANTAPDVRSGTKH